MGWRFLQATSVLAAAWVTLSASVGHAAPLELNQPLTVETLPAPKLGERRVWVHDYALGLYGRAILVNADTGDWLGMIDTGWEGVKLDFDRDRKVIYNVGLYMSRGFHGQRVDVLEIFDANTLKILGEIPLPAKMIRGWPNLHHSAMTDDNRFMLVHFYTPASSIGVIDLQARKYVGEIETAGCAHVMSAGGRRFLMLCGDGSALEVQLTDAGRERARIPHKDLFDAVNDPLHGTGVRREDIWTLVSQKGAIHRFDVAGGGFKALPAWTPPADPAGPPGVPGQIIENIALHAASNQLYMLIHRGSLEPKGGGIDYHRQPGTEIWVVDLNTSTVARKFPLPRPTEAIAISQDATPHLYATTLGLPDVLVLDAATGAPVRSLDGGSTPLLLLPVEASR